MKHTDCEHCLGASHTRRDFLRVGTLSFHGRSASVIFCFPQRAGSGGDCFGYCRSTGQGSGCHFGLAGGRDQPSRQLGCKRE